MARRGRDNTVTEETTTVEEFQPELEVDGEGIEEVDVPAEDDEAEVIASTEGSDTSEEKPAKEPAAPKRGDLPEGFITPVAFAKVLSQPLDGNAENLDPSNWRYTHSKSGDHVVAPQMVYSYIRSAKDGKNPLATQTVTDSNGVQRENILVLADALAWWDAKAKRTAASAENAKAKAEKKAAKPEATETASATDAAPVGEVEEAE